MTIHYEPDYKDIIEMIIVMFLIMFHLINDKNDNKKRLPRVD